MYEFKSDIKFSDGGLDELLALDRYAVPTFDPMEIYLGDKVIVIVDKDKDERKVVRIKKILQDGNEYKIIAVTSEGKELETSIEHVQKPLETTPQEFWARWAKGAASVEETEEKRLEAEDRYRELLDGYAYSPGGRIQLMLGQEFVTGKKAQLTAYNCFVIPNPKGSSDPVEQWMHILDSAKEEMDIMRRGGGVGLNLSDIKTVRGAKINKDDIFLCLSDTHKDFEEVVTKQKIGKFNHVEAHSNNIDVFREKEMVDIIVGDSIEELVQAMKDMVLYAYAGKVVILDFSYLRPRNSIVKGVNGRSSGAASWMEMFDLIASLLQQETIDAVDFAEIFSAVVHLIQQGGSRRGALMLIMNDSRRDILEKFITRKRTPGKLTGANVSVGISDSFMVHASKPGTEEERLWNLIVESAHASAEPGVVWLETMNKWSNSWYFSELVATNP